MSYSNNNNYRTSASAISFTSTNGYSTAVITSVVQRHPVQTATCCSLYLLGLGLLTFFTGFTSSTEQLNLYYDSLPNKEDSKKLNTYLYRMEDSYERYYNSKGWFWTCNDICTKNYQQYIKDKQNYDNQYQQYQQRISNAKATLGIFSETAIEETKDLLYKIVNSGKQFVSYQSKWDIFFSLFFRGISWSYNDDTNFFSWLIDIIFRITMNVIMAVIGVVISFAFSVWSIITAYQATYLETFIFYTGAILAVLSFGITVCFGCCGLAVFSVVAPTTYVINNALQNDPSYQQQQQRRYLHPHNE